MVFWKWQIIQPKHFQESLKLDLTRVIWMIKRHQLLTWIFFDFPHWSFVFNFAQKFQKLRQFTASTLKSDHFSNFFRTFSVFRFITLAHSELIMRSMLRFNTCCFASVTSWRWFNLNQIKNQNESRTVEREHLKIV